MIDRIYDKGLIDEMISYSPIKFSSKKAEVMYHLCMSNRKFKLARKILQKYSEEKFDSVMSMMFSLTVSDFVKQKHRNK